MRKNPNVREIIELFSDPNALKEIYEIWERNEPKSMAEIFDEMPNSSLNSFHKKN